MTATTAARIWAAPGARPRINRPRTGVALAGWLAISGPAATPLRAGGVAARAAGADAPAPLGSRLPVVELTGDAGGGTTGWSAGGPAPTSPKAGANEALTAAWACPSTSTS